MDGYFFFLSHHLKMYKKNNIIMIIKLEIEKDLFNLYLR